MSGMLEAADLTLVFECTSSLVLNVVVVLLVKEFVRGNWVKELVMISET